MPAKTDPPPMIRLTRDEAKHWLGVLDEVELPLEQFLEVFNRGQKQRGIDEQSGGAKIESRPLSKR